MEHVLYRLHIRILQGSNRFLGHKTRRVMEFGVLAFGVVCLAVLCTMHKVYVSNSSELTQNCLTKALHGIPSPGNIDVVEINIVNARKNIFSKGGVLGNPNDSYLFSYERGLLMLGNDIRDRNNFTRQTFDFDARSECFGPLHLSFILNTWAGYDIVLMNWAVSTFGGKGFLFKTKTKELFNLNYASDFESKKGISLHDKGRNVHLHLTDNVVSKLYTNVFGNNKGEQTPINTDATADASNQCFGLLTCARGEQCLNSELSGSLSDCIGLVVLKANQFAGFKIGVLLSILFLFIVTTTLVSYTLRETQQRMLKFTYLLQYHVAHQLPIVSLVATHVLESLIFVPIIMGMYFFLFEFFSDQLLAFLVILVVWMGEIFAVLSCRCRTSIRYFPKLFACYFTMFHLYFFTFPFGFSYLALLTAVAFILHTMMHLWNLFEVPAVEVGEVHAHRMRFGFEVPNEALGHLGIGGVANMSRTSLAQDFPTDSDEAVHPVASSPTPFRRGLSIGSTDRLLASEDNINVALPSQPVIGSPLRFPTSADTANNSRTFAGNFPSIYESASARTARLSASEGAQRGHGGGNDHSPPSAAPGSNSRAFNSNRPSIYESLSARTARLALAREEAAQSGRESPPLPTHHYTAVSGSSARSAGPVMGGGAAFQQPVMTRVRSNSEGSNIWRTPSELNYSTAGNNERSLNTIGYNRNSYNVFGDLMDD